ncbi:MAG TPA: DegT/DnrJ/EryC1/StrS family aminotransferase [Candidatus Omnitrophota bacterium]|nr:DegT/DnrJ/EryC1/StrS family aminotransferase [Candidatus Omnitrophota bacterium]
MNVPFLDLNAQYRALKPRIDRAIRAVVTRQDFILGQDVRKFEEEFAAYCNSRYCIGVNSGTDGLFLCLKAMGIGPGDEVIVPAFTFIATAFVVTCAGARPVFVDIDGRTFNIDIEKAKAAVTARTKAVIPVHLFGQCADMDPLRRFARSRGIAVVEDACQAHGALYKGEKAGTMGNAGVFSFYPTKNLGAWGDAGAIVTDNMSLYKKLFMMRDCGRKSKYEHVILGYNSRLGTLQAAVLRVKLAYLDRWNRKRKACAAAYTRFLSKVPGVRVPFEAPHNSHVYHIYAILVERRDAVVDHLKKRRVGCMVNYPAPLHLQRVYKNLGYRTGAFPVSEDVSKRIISLPMHPFLSMGQISYVVQTVKSALKEA